MTDAAIQRAGAEPSRSPGRRRRGRSGATPPAGCRWLRIATLAFLFVPFAIATYDFNFNLEAVGARPLNNVIHRTGFWALVFLLTYARHHAAASDRAASISLSMCAA